MAKFDPYRKWLGIPPEEQPPNHYRLLGIGLFESDPDVVAGAADRQMTHVRTFQSGKRAEVSQRILNELAAARVCLLDPQQRAAYDSQLRVQQPAEPSAPPPPPTAPPPTAPPPAPAARAAPPVAVASPAPEVLAPATTFPAARRSTTTYVARRKKSSWQVPVILGVMLALAGVLLAWVLGTSESQQPRTPHTPTVKLNGNGSSGLHRPQGPTNGSRRRNNHRTTRSPDRNHEPTGQGPIGIPGVDDPADVPGHVSLSGDVGEICSLVGHTEPAPGVAFSPTGMFVFSGSEDKTVRMWDIERRAELRRFAGSSQPITAVAVSSDGTSVLGCSGRTNPPADGVLLLWQTGSGELTDRIELGTAVVAWDAGFSSDGRHVLLGCQDGTVRLLDPAEPEKARTFAGHAGPVRSVAFSADGAEVLSGGDDRTARLWDRNTGEPLVRMVAHTAPVTSVAFSPDGNYVLSGSADKTLRLWDASSGDLRYTLEGHQQAVTSVACTPGGLLALSGSLDGTIRLWKLSNGMEVYRFEQPGQGIRSLAISSTGREAVSGGENGVVRLWKLPALSAIPGSLVDGSGRPGEPAGDAQDEEFERLAVPDGDSQQQALDIIKSGDFREAFAAADRPSRRLALAEKLLAEGTKTQDNPAVAYTMMRFAWEEATSQGNADLALKSVEQIARRYQVDPLAAKAKTLESLARALSGAASSRKRELVARALSVIDEAMAADDFQTATRLVVSARALAAGTRDESLRKLVIARAKQVQQLQDRHEEIQQALEVLTARPDDPAANDAVGAYLCFLKGDWAQGLPRLAAGGDERLKKLARLDLANSPLIIERLALADGWWEASEQAESPAQEQMQQRAARWYKQIVSELAEPDRSRAEQRLLEAGDPSAIEQINVLPPIRGLECRQQVLKAAMLETFGGNQQTEAAVHRACQWLADHQYPDGSWDFNHETPRFKGKARDPGRLKAPNAATALALLPLLGSGNGPRQGEYRKNVSTALSYLRSHMMIYATAATLYEPRAKYFPSHALGTIALCEASASRSDRQSRIAAQVAVKFIVLTQNQDGGWGYAPKTPKTSADESNLGATAWNIAALKAAEWSGIKTPSTTLDQARKYLDSMRTQDRTGYRRDSNSDARDSTATAEAVLSQMYLGWPRRHPQLAAYVAEITPSGPSTRGHLLLNFLNSQILRDTGNSGWQTWNAALRDHLIAAQESQADEAGSWMFHSSAWHNKYGGRLYCTALAALILEVYYRNPPIYPPGN